MKNHVTYETAARLKEAGFPQPVTELGQIWYRNGILGVAMVAFGEIEVWQPLDVGGEWQRFSDEDAECVFAPTATDILRLSFNPNDSQTISASALLDLAIDPESAAQDWLELNEKQAEK